MGVTVSPTCRVPKSDGTTRLVINYSDIDKQGQSVNSRQNPAYGTCKYTDLVCMIAAIRSQGKGAYFWTGDLESGYFNVNFNNTDIPKTCSVSICRTYLGSVGINVWIYISYIYL